MTILPLLMSGARARIMSRMPPGWTATSSAGCWSPLAALDSLPSSALEELAMLLISTGELTAEDLRRLPSQPTA